MFCPKCGTDAQSVESYCKRCGEWLPDLENLGRPRLFRKSSRDEKIRKMRVLEAISAGLSLTSAAIIISILAGGGERQMLFLAAFCSILVVVYQIINFYLGYKIQQKINHSRIEGIKEIEPQAEKGVGMLGSADTTQFVNNHSVIDNTTELLEPIPQRIRQDK
jgi:hypothetical protein